MEDDQAPPPESQLPYAAWTEDALRQVVIKAIDHVSEHGLPGAHHFYLTFRTDMPGVVIPAHVRAQYPQEMTIVLQHQFWDLKYIPEAAAISVGLSFGGVASTLMIPLASVVAFVDPHIQYGLRFNPVMTDAPAAEPPPEPAEPVEEAPPAEAPQVVSLDAFRRRTPPKH